MNITRTRISEGGLGAEHFFVLSNDPTIVRFASLYYMDTQTLQIMKIKGYIPGPSEISAADVTHFLHYNVSSRRFEVQHTKQFTPATDVFVLQNNAKKKPIQTKGKIEVI